MRHSAARDGIPNCKGMEVCDRVYAISRISRTDKRSETARRLRRSSKDPLLTRNAITTMSTGFCRSECLCTSRRTLADRVQISCKLRQGCIHGLGLRDRREPGVQVVGIAQQAQQSLPKAAQLCDYYRSAMCPSLILMTRSFATEEERRRLSSSASS